MKKPTAIGVHIFAGGFTCGVKKAGFNVLCHLETGKYGVSTANLNWPKMPIYVGEKNWPLEILAEQSVDLLYSNPPCAIFSPANPRSCWKEDPRTECWRQAINVFQRLQPRVFALESVTQALTKGRELIDEITQQAVSMRYSVQHILLDTMWIGVAQRRKRFFLVCHRPEIPLELRFNYTEPPTVLSELQKVDSPGTVHTYFHSSIPGTKPGKKLRDTFDKANFDKFGCGSGRPGFLHQRAPVDGVMSTVTGNTFAHPIENRYLGINELKRLCGYPQDFQLARDSASLLARAVLPPVGEWLSRAVRNALVGKGPRCYPSVTLVDLRKAPGSYLNQTANYEVRCSKKRHEFLQLVCSVKSCNQCPAMRGRLRVLSQSNGNPNANLLFVGEAPGRLGAGLTGIPFHHDATGVNFERLLRSAGLSRNDVFVTNAVLCNPLENEKNRPPTTTEVANCLSHLCATIDQVDPLVVITLGATALSICNRIYPHCISLRQNVGKLFSWYNRKLLPLYHPSPRVIATTRNLVSMQKDFSILKKWK